MDAKVGTCRIMELARQTGIADKTLYEWATQGRFITYKVGRIVLVNIASFYAYVENNQRKIESPDAVMGRVLQKA